MIELLCTVTFCLVVLHVFGVTENLGKILIGLNNRRLKDRVEILESKSHYLETVVETLQQDQEFMQKLLEVKRDGMEP